MADALARIWNNSGQFGQFTDIETGDILVGGSASCAIAPAALARAATWCNEPNYLAVAQSSARQYHEHFVRQGITNGGPSEILSAPDSESSFAMLESFVTLLEVTGDPYWRKASVDMLRQFATWVVSYDYRFPSGSLFGQSGAHTTGAVWAISRINMPRLAFALLLAMPCCDSGAPLGMRWRSTSFATSHTVSRNTSPTTANHLAPE